MDRAELRQTFDRLHAALESARAIDPGARADLERALDEIREVIERDSRREAEEPSLRERLEEFALRFERSHPVLSEAIGNVVNALATMGI